MRYCNFHTRAASFDFHDGDSEDIQFEMTENQISGARSTNSIDASLPKKYLEHNQLPSIIQTSSLNLFIMQVILLSFVGVGMAVIVILILAICAVVAVFLWC